MTNPFERGRIPWWNAFGAKPVSVVRMNTGALALRVRLGSGERVVMPLHPATLEQGGQP
jgi:hypothetical protein